MEKKEENKENKIKMVKPENKVISPLKQMQGVKLSKITNNNNKNEDEKAKKPPAIAPKNALKKLPNNNIKTNTRKEEENFLLKIRSGLKKGANIKTADAPAKNVNEKKNEPPKVSGFKNLRDIFESKANKQNNQAPNKKKVAGK